MTSRSSTHPGHLHRIFRPPASITYATISPIVVFEHASPKTSPLALPSDSAHNTLIFLGGLTDGLLTVPFVPPIVASLPPSWSLVEPILGSSYRQFGISSLDEDVSEIEVVVKYFKALRPDGCVVLLGHSTGSQMIMHYLLSEEERKGARPAIDGGIMQGCASDREALVTIALSVEIEEATELAQQYVKDGRGSHVLPKNINDFFFEDVPLTANRWLSLASPGPDHAGQDDYFSSDLSDERLRTTFGKLGAKGARVSWIYGENDQFVPKSVDKHELVNRWHTIAREGGALIDQGSGVFKGGSHTLKEGGTVTEEFTRNINEFLKKL